MSCRAFGRVQSSQTGHTGLRGRGVLPRGWSKWLVGAVGAAVFRNRPHRPGGTGSPAHRVVRVSRGACGGAAVFRNRAHRPGGTGSPAQGVVRVSFRACGGAAVFRTRAHRPSGTGSPAQGVVGVSCRAFGEAAVFRTWAHRPGQTGSHSQGWSECLVGPAKVRNWLAPKITTFKRLFYQK